MKVCGIIAEYNPLHNGHLYQIKEARKQSGADIMIAIMSGNFVQRGEPAVLDKFTRAKAAVENGIDVVIELPYIYATESASYFAKGGVKLLELAGADYISFGSECGNLENLMEIADTPVNPDHLHMSLSKGLSFPKAYSLLTSTMEPNDILAVSYLKAMKGTSIQPVIIQRTSGYLDTTLSTNASALAIRTALKEEKEIDGSTVMAKQLQEADIPWMEKYYPYLRTFLLTSNKERLSEMFLFSEGIENHLVRCAKDCNTWDAFLNMAVTHRYTAGRIRRCVLQALNQITKYEVSRLPEMDTLRILAFNEKGRQWLHSMRKKDVRIASRFADVPYPWRVMEYRTTLLYTSVMDETKRKEILDKEIGGPVYVR